MSLYSCPCCSHSLLRHIRSQQIYWYCRHCHQAMPNLSLEIAANHINILNNNLHQHLAPKIAHRSSKIQLMAI
ncbi:MAG: hypothetical protein SAJ12_05925 [Jaaginema sp. PMC 1079.18]|nr:hypothetical protein [Jaaginema sp. PMC 1080.18]MEC4850529.1 hypothetical protein [Jaaginema sp. PMC 1079.18]MEC4865785.1 hypothetical protein [Jaaginema sp. PMC 1078.18]